MIRDLEALDAAEWDVQIAADAAGGKLDFLIAEALDAETRGGFRLAHRVYLNHVNWNPDF